MIVRSGTFLLVFLAAGIIGCNRKASYQPQSSPVMVDKEAVLLGQIPYRDILYYFPNWAEAHQNAVADPTIVARFRAIDQPLHIMLFLGTWCSDSWEGVPPFMKVVEEARNPNIRITVIAVDRNMMDPEGMGIRYQVERVPTFVVLRNESELGRLVEIPLKSFAEDLLDLLGQ